MTSLETMHCTCGPHPHIDLTAAYANYHGHGNGNDAKDAMSPCREQIRDACRSHGCFHVAIDLAGAIKDSSTPNRRSSLECLAKSSRQIEENIESLFSPSFLEDAAERCSEEVSSTESGDFDDAIGDKTNWESICNGGLLEIPFPGSGRSLPTNAGETVGNASDDTNAQSATPASASATFRGRVAESGDRTHPTPEPKLSWEYRRCITNNTESDSRHNVNNSETNNSYAEAWRHLPKFTGALHSVASMVIHLLDIPPQLVLQENQCNCFNQTNNADQCKGSCCNIDLLRVFRYDALPPPKNEGQIVMGSSAHSDWGTLTVVWQDHKGGLQTYCHACDKWSDVDAASPCASTSNNNVCESSNTCSLFVHVGDFLSLATREGESNNGSVSVPAWPSPRHRVLCPQENPNLSSGSGDECRRSLVYFAYPPPGVSLNEARKYVAPLAFPSSSNPNIANDDNDAEFYEHYSLLHDQSHESPSADEQMLLVNKYGDGLNKKQLAAFQTHQRIEGISFDRVIFDKWNQVQRSA